MVSKVWTVTRDKVLTKAEIQTVLDELHRKSKRSKLTRRNLIIFRLSTCCGLRVGELTQLTLSNVRLGVRPMLYVPGSISKASRWGKAKSRTVPLHWDKGTLADLTAWKAEREAEGARGDDLFVSTKSGGQIDTKAARKAFQSCCRVLGRPVTIHYGRHSFISHALHAGRSVVEVRDAAGHSGINITNGYAHLVGDDDGVIGNLFG
jgi:integrase